MLITTNIAPILQAFTKPSPENSYQVNIVQNSPHITKDHLVSHTSFKRTAGQSMAINATGQRKPKPASRAEPLFWCQAAFNRADFSSSSQPTPNRDVRSEQVFRTL